MTACPRTAARLLVECLERRETPAIIVTTTADAGAGSLRAAIAQANQNGPGHDDIVFAIPGAGPHTIALATALPTLASSVTVDGYTQPGAAVNTLSVGTNADLRIEIDGGGAGNFLSDRYTNGQILDGGQVSVRGLSLVNFSGAAL